MRRWSPLKPLFLCLNPAPLLTLFYWLHKTVPVTRLCHAVCNLWAFLKIELRLTCHKIYPLRVYSSVVFSLFMRSCHHHHCMVFRAFLSAQKIPGTHCHSLPMFSSSALCNHSSTFCLHTLAYKIMQYVAFCYWLLSLIRMFLSFLHVVA